MTTMYDFSAQSLGGKEELPLSRYQGKVALVVNTASQCGLTPQYTGLEELHKKYHAEGLEVLGFPCNQFGSQEPGTADEIGAFCTKNYGVTFQMFDKIDVNGANAHPLYKWLTSSAPGILGTEAIKWNFGKFLVGKDGSIIKRYAPTTSPKDVAADIEKALAG
jgi:glutathione peroxidase